MSNTAGLLVEKQKERYLQTFLIALAVAAATFIPFIIYDNGYFLFYGDFNVQQVPFYQMAHDAVRSGNIFWNWNTDLGVNFIGSYSFYLLGSPFFWLTLLFPSSAVPHLMGPLLILKFACSALTAYCYLRRFCRYTHNATIGALLYAFSGFSVYNIFFNHFHEAIVFFPLLLLSLEMFMAENKRGLFALTVAMCCVSNYFFFVGMVVFTVIYFFIRLFSRAWSLTVGRFACLALEAVLGLLLAMFLLLPSAMAVLQNSRVDSFMTGWDAILYGKNQIFLNVIEVFFFPPDLPARPVFFTGSDVKWSSLGGWLPLFGMTGVIAWLQAKRGSWLKRIIVTCIIMALVPVLNSAFYMFNWAYYARWFYMPILMMALATAKALEDSEINWASAFRWSIGITMAFTLVIGLFPRTYSDGKFSDFGLYDQSQPEYKTRFWIWCAIAVGCLTLLAVLFHWRGLLCRPDENRGKWLHTMRKSVGDFTLTATALVCLVSFGYSAMFIGIGKNLSYDTKNFIIPNLIEGEIDLPDRDTCYRVDVYDGMDNTAMFLGYPTIQAFHSIVPASVTEFYESVGVERGVASRPETEHYQIRSLLNCRFLFDYDGAGSQIFSAEENNATMPGWTQYDYQNGFYIYENQYYIPYGCTYEHYISDQMVDAEYSSYRESVMLKAIILTDEQIERYGSLLTDIGTINYEDFSEQSYFDDCTALRQTSVNNGFEKDNRGFTSTVNLHSDNLVMFAVPYDSGWSATVDGEAVTVEKVNNGLMAVLVPAGEHTVRFDYTTPGLTVGIIISAVAIVLLAAYILLCRVYYRRHSQMVEYPEGAQMQAANDADDLAVKEYEDSLFSPDSEQEAAKIDEDWKLDGDDGDQVAQPEEDDGEQENP